MARKLLTFALILGCACVAPARAQKDTCQQKSIAVSLGSADNTPLPSLSSANFEGTYEKKPVRVTSAAIIQEAPRVVVLLDASDSMSGPSSKSLWNFSVAAGEDVVAQLPPKSEIGLAFFSTKSVRVANPTSERQILAHELEALRTGSKTLVPKPRKTALWDAILDSLNMFDGPRLGDTIYVITDGGDNASKTTWKDVARTLGESGVRLFALLVRYDAGRVQVAGETAGPQPLLEIVGDTGGIVISFYTGISGVFPSPKDTVLFDDSGKTTPLGILLGSQYRQIFSFYRLDIELPATVDKPRQWKLDLVGLGKSQRHNLVLTYPLNLAPCL